MRLYLILAVALAFAGLGLWGQQQHLSATKARAEVNALTVQLAGTKAALDASLANGKRLSRISDARQVKINQLALTAQRTQKALNDALKENRAWADAPVPDSVWDAIAPDAADRSVPTGPGVDAGGAGAEPAGQGQRGASELGEGSPRGAGDSEHEPSVYPALG